MSVRYVPLSDLPGILREQGIATSCLRRTKDGWFPSTCQKGRLMVAANDVPAICDLFKGACKVCNYGTGHAPIPPAPISAGAVE